MSQSDRVKWMEMGVRGVRAAAVAAVLGWAVRGAAGQAVTPVEIGAGGGRGMPALVPGARVVQAATEAPAAVAGGEGAAGARVEGVMVAQVITPPPAPAAPTVTPATPAGTEAPAATAPAGAAAPVSAGQTGTAAAGAGAEEGSAYPITGIQIDYRDAHPQHPAMEKLLGTEIRLAVVDGAYAAARPGAEAVTVKLSELGKEGGPQKIYRSGIRAIYNHVVRYFNGQGIIGVFVVVDSNDIDAEDTDIRPADRRTLQFVVVTSTVKQVRTVAKDVSGDRENLARHASIRRNSPLQPTPEAAATQSAAGLEGGAAAAVGGRADLLRKDVLDEYVLRLNRQPGRRVDVAMSGTGEAGRVTLDYLVSESRPWYVYGQISNTGTEQTNRWRERFGFVHNQLTGHDDILAVDYLTAGFENTNAVIGSYELPFFQLDRLRYKVFASWNQYTASDVGQNDEEFTGDAWTAGNELIGNVYQHRELFVDAVVGLRFQSIKTDNITADTQGAADYVQPYVSLRLDRATDIATTIGSVTLVGGLTNANGEELEGLGRAEPTRRPVTLQFDLAQSFYLEPLLAPEQFASGTSSLAHEVYLAARGQWAFGSRLIPQFQDVAGGLYSVRGYPESIVAGDNVIIGTAEYRFHLPRVLAVQSDPQKTPFLWDESFRFSPQHPYGRPDWDLIFRGFVDAARVVNSSRQPFERDATLVGAGVGVELQYKQNFNVRVDWGAALTEIEDEVRAGSNRFHISSTILY